MTSEEYGSKHVLEKEENGKKKLAIKLAIMFGSINVRKAFFKLNFWKKDYHSRLTESLLKTLFALAVHHVKQIIEKWLKVASAIFRINVSTNICIFYFIICA